MHPRKHKQNYNLRKKKMYTPEGYIGDPPDAKCPHCGKSNKGCSYVNSLSRAWARDICSRKHKNIKNDEDSN